MIFVFLCLTTQYDNLWVHSWHCIWHYFWKAEKKENKGRKVCNYVLLTWYWRRLLRVPWTARRSNQSILKEISTGCSWEGMMLKLKLQYFGHLM